jgi:hypothetical protein
LDPLTPSDHGIQPLSDKAIHTHIPHHQRLQSLKKKCESVLGCVPGSRTCMYL